MTTAGQFSTKNPTIKRILKEASELSSNPSPDYHATPLETDLFQWHFTIRGPPSPSPFASGLYHGQITLPASYPLKPPNFRFLTPSGRFEVNREICLSISGHHEESWQPAWGIRTALVAIRAFMDSEAGGQLGGMSAAEGVRRKLAGESRGWVCGGCGKSNEEILREQAELCEKGEEEDRERREREEMLAKEIGFAAKEKKAGDGSSAAAGADAAAAASSSSASASASTNVGKSAPVPLPSSQGSDAKQQQQQQQHSSTPTPTPTRTVPSPAPQLQQRPPPQQISHDVWLDRAIIGIAIALVAMVLRQFLE